MKNLKPSLFVFSAVLLNLTALSFPVSADDQAALIRAQTGMYSARANAQTGMYNARANAQTGMYSARANAQTGMYSARTNARIGMTNALGNTQAANIAARAQAIEAQALVLNAKATVIAAIANARATDAKTLETIEQVRSLSLDNSLKKAKTYYDKRALHKDYRAANKQDQSYGKRVNRSATTTAFDQSDKYQQAPVREGRVYWPSVLEKDEFAEQRTKLDDLFTTWHDSAYGCDVYQQVKDVTEEMQVELRSMIREMSPTEYLEARKFIDSLADESQSPKRPTST